MRSVPQAMLWEMWRHGRGNLLLGAVGANFLPVVLFAALDQYGALDSTSSELIVMQVVLVQMNMFAFAAAVIAAQGQPSRLYAMPIATSSLVTWHLLPAMAIMGLQSAVSAAALNAAFDLGWPVWGPALFAAVAMAAVQAAFWLTEKTAWVVVAVALVGAGLGIWFKARCGEPFSQPTRLWSEVTFGEVATLLAVAALSYCVALIGVARSRRGDPLPSLGALAWLGRVVDPAPRTGLPFRSAAQAQLWFEWRQKGWAMPGAAIVGLLLGCGMWLLFSRDAKELFEGFVAGGALLSLAGMLGGVVVGNCGTRDDNFEIGHFMATRPMTNTDMARIVLKTAGRSVLLAWIIWAAAFAALYAIQSAIHVAPPLHLPKEWGWWYFPATLLGAWTVLGALASICLTGRVSPFAALAGLICLVLGLMLFSKLGLSPAAQAQFGRGALAAGGAALSLGTFWVFAAARRRGLIGWPTVYVAGSLWAALWATVALSDLLPDEQRLLALTLLAGVGALAVAPLAAAPLALAWNRNR